MTKTAFPVNTGELMVLLRGFPHTTPLRGVGCVTVDKDGVAIEPPKAKPKKAPAKAKTKKAKG